MEKKSIKCQCGHMIDTSNNPQTAICPVCNRRYGRQAPKLKLLDIEVDRFLTGVIIS